ncbi:hypothetical protein [Pseudomarimonas arenosa]|uniref:Solute-binding protein family 3/N-terminal domain-containing protein n=1 Tax=Pseudomarimonas arenosa TaxID=2774145 RepID=A0AAW3ZM16_9GAMM|nr:hypothetical protein [Pseudomarimonas arenosa]MBD8526778.1 hypothetical protein [Pseudomarimonas arenosa]
MRNGLWILLAVLALLPELRAESPRGQVVLYPPGESSRDPRSRYPVQVLELALQRAGHSFIAMPSEVHAQQSRNLLLLAERKGIDVLWTVTSEQRERDLRPIRIPIDRGLFGWRLLLIRQGDQARFDRIDSLHALAGLRGGQGHDWPDTPVLESAGLKIETAPHYEGLFAMLARGHIDYFPRSVAEVWAELALRQDQSMALENTLVLHYPSALYFFVHPDNQPLAEAIERGLRQALADGSFLALFRQQFGSAIERARLTDRRILSLANPLLPQRTPVAESALWFRPDEGKL